MVHQLHPDNAENNNYFDTICVHPADNVMRKEYQYQGVIQYVADKLIIDLGNTVIEIAEMPGHTPG